MAKKVVNKENQKSEEVVVEEAKSKKSNTITEEENKAFQEKLRVDTQLSEDMLGEPAPEEGISITNEVSKEENIEVNTLNKE